MTTSHLGHDPSHGPTGTDVLLNVFEDGTMRVQLRPGLNVTWVQWSPPVELADASVMRVVGEVAK